MTRRILVTGGTGFIGRHTIKPLVDRGFEVLVATTKANPDLENGEPVRLDLTDHTAVAATMKDLRASHLLHIAWEPVAAGLWHSRANINWTMHSINLARAFVESGGERLVGVGSCGEYDWAGGLCREDTTPLTPSTVYGDAKLSIFHAMNGLCAANKVSFGWCRPFFVYGPAEDASRLGASVINSLLADEPAECTHGLQLRDYMHCADVGSGLAALASSDLTGAFNIASGQAIRVRDLISALAEAAGKPDLVRLGARQAPAFEPPLILADMNKTRTALDDWKPVFDLQSGAADTVSWYQERRS